MATIGRAYDSAKQLWYQDVPGKGRIFDSPVAYGGTLGGGGGGAFHKDPEWDQATGTVDKGLDWGKLYAWGTGAALGVGALSAAGAFGGAAGAPGAGGAGGGTLSGAGTGLLPSTTIGSGAVGPISGGVSGSGMGGGMGWLDIAKDIYGGYNKAKSVYDTGKSIYGDVAGSAGDAAGGAAYGRAQGRIAEAAAQQAQDRLELERARLASLNTADANRFTIEKSTADLAQRKYALEAPGQRAGNAVRGDVLAHAQDATVDPGSLGPNVHVPTISGGLRPSMFSDATRSLGGLMSSQALAGQQAGDTFDPLTYQTPAPIPGLTPLPQSGGVDDFLTTAGYVGTGLDKFMQWLERYKAQQQGKSTPQVQSPTSTGLLDPDTEGNYA